MANVYNLIESATPLSSLCRKMDKITFNNIEFYKIKDFETYFVSKCGNVYSKKRNAYTLNSNKILKKIYDKDGYCYLKLYDKNSKRFHKRICRLVAETFINNPKNKPCVNHKNGVKDDDRVENLEWVTYSENEKHKYYILGRESSNKNKFGRLNKLSKKVYQYDIKLNLIKIWDSNMDIMRHYKQNSGAVSRVCNGHLKTYKGYIWSYKPLNQ